MHRKLLFYAIFILLVGLVYEKLLPIVYFLIAYDYVMTKVNNLRKIPHIDEIFETKISERITDLKGFLFFVLLMITPYYFLDKSRASLNVALFALFLVLFFITIWKAWKIDHKIKSLRKIFHK